MKTGFYPALGTPLDEMGYLITKSMEEQVQDQIEAGAAGLLVMGSMGIEPYIRQSEYRKVAAAVAEMPCFGRSNGQFYNKSSGKDRKSERLEN